MPGKMSFHDDRKRILAEPLDLTGAACVRAHWSDGKFEKMVAEQKGGAPVELGEGLRTYNHETPTPVRSVLECPDYVDFQPVKALIFADKRWKHAFTAKTKADYRVIWLSEVSLGEALAEMAGNQAVA